MIYAHSNIALSIIVPELENKYLGLIIILEDAPFYDFFGVVGTVELFIGIDTDAHHSAGHVECH